ncbi:hypothetical protein NSK_000022 [Nannochloropsis salina CCMP1776]|uniref:Proteasome alpha-type subunits domain-containing protein n=1 Tax=Nannochloropsis salina CCMP1776 TaxID=1027361 RepID=A0A4D9DHS2_9STRA|nr:hypothetical protein NSK_000022 [Nannochloropsis salina CCMP1776]|eukprot:TFJ88448.1 hypothetical protein NSK_000022 [Nannochloropsis salina CCMP1776]
MDVSVRGGLWGMGALLLGCFVNFFFVPALCSSPPSTSVPNGGGTAPGGFSSRGELPQLDFARLGAYRFASPSLCVRTRRACYVLCARPEQHPLQDNYEVDPLSRDTITIPATTSSSTGRGVHLVSPGIGCLCQGQDGDVLALVGLMRREAEKYLHAFGHPISARVLAQRVGTILGGKGQETWSRPLCCISVLMSSSGAAKSAAAIPSSPFRSSSLRGEAEMYQIDPTGLVFSIRGQVFGGKDATDPVAHDLQEWLGCFLQERDAEEEKGREEGEENEQEIWTALWTGMKKFIPNVAQHPESVECARAAASSFRRLGPVTVVVKGQEGVSEE